MLNTRTGRGVVDSVTDLIGATPVVRLGRMAREVPAAVLAKLEAMNPGRSVKDRSVLGMIEAAERGGLISAGRSVIVEATSGNAVWRWPWSAPPGATAASSRCPRAWA